MKKHFSDLLHKTLPGTVHAQYNTCGKKNCRCARGNLHGAYYYHFVYVDGKLTKRYLKASEVEETRAACAARQEQRRQAVESEREFWSSLRNLREELRSLQGLYKEYFNE